MEELIKVLPPKIKELQQAEYVYARRHAALFMQSGMGTIVAKEAEATSICDEEGLYNPLVDARGDLKGLYNEKDMLLCLSANLRTLARNKDAE